MLRIALLSMMEPVEGAGSHETARTGLPLRAGLRVGGGSLARYQLALALALGCERIICLADQVDAELVALQHAAEDAGATLHRAAGAAGLLGLVSTADEVIALVDGLLAWPQTAEAQLQHGPVVMSQPAETGLAKGFERIDAVHAAAGAMCLPGRLIERLSEHAADCDVFSTLQRIALQAGVPQRELPTEAYEAGRWNLIRSEAEAHRVEPLWIRLLTASQGRATPAMVVARQGVRWFGPALLHAGSNGTVVGIAAAVTQALALVLGWFSLPVAALVLSAWGWVLFLAASLFGRAERAALRLASPRIRPVAIYAGVMDGVLLALLTWLSAAGAAPLWQRAFAPALLLGLMRLVARTAPVGRGVWLEDRAMLALVLALAAAAGWLGPAIAGLAVAVLIYGLLSNEPPSG